MQKVEGSSPFSRSSLMPYGLGALRSLARSPISIVAAAPTSVQPHEQGITHLCQAVPTARGVLGGGRGRSGS